MKKGDCREGVQVKADVLWLDLRVILTCQGYKNRLGKLQRFVLWVKSTYRYCFHFKLFVRLEDIQVLRS